MYTAVAAVVVVVIVIAAVAWYMTGDKGGDDTGEGDTYYFYLDGMGDISGWYQAEGDNAEVALKNALNEANIEYEIEDGNIKRISTYVPNINNNYFGTYVYMANNVDVPTSTNFATGPMLDDINGNIVYITYGTYVYDEFGLQYTPSPFTNSEMFASGPFVSDEYEPLNYDDTYWFYLDGIGDIDGWYSATGENAEVALKSALDSAGITYKISDGWISGINDIVEEGKYFGTYLYTCNDVSVADPYSFSTGPVLDEMAGNIVYITLSSYKMNDYYVTIYDLNPTNTTSDMMSTGPFATA